MTTPHKPSRKLTRALSIFGPPSPPQSLPPAPPPSSPAPAALPGRSAPSFPIDSRNLAREALASRIVFLTGPSGAGKSTLLGEVERRRGSAAVRSAPFSSRAGAPLVDSIPFGLRRTLAALARAGLAEAPLFAAPVDTLSDGQRCRAALARAIARVDDRVSRGWRAVLVVDEFAAALDRRGAGALAAGLARWARSRPGIGLLIATSHDDLLEPLRPDVVAWVENARVQWGLAADLPAPSTPPAPPAPLAPPAAA